MLNKATNILLIRRSDSDRNPGGDMVQLNTTAAELKSRGYKVDVKQITEVKDWSSYDIIQVFNIGRPAEILPAVQAAKPICIFSIWVDFHELDCRLRAFPVRMLAKISGKFGWEYIKTIARWGKGQVPFPGWRYVLLGQKRSMQHILNHAAVLQVSTQSELNRLRQYFTLPAQTYVVPLGVNEIFFSGQEHRSSDDICFAGYIEARKGVLPLIRVCNRRKWTLHIYGKASAQNALYEAQCRNEAGSTIHFHGYQPQSVYRDALRKCRIVALPSWFETTGLSALEGGVMGKALVIGERGDTKEVFGTFAHYCNPESEESIEAALEQAFASETDERQLNYFARFTVKNHVDKLIKTYIHAEI
jgi:glycosyltransferase involved in cell wall biosynthesis